jgi:hypothetical protein
MSFTEIKQSEALKPSSVKTLGDDAYEAFLRAKQVIAVGIENKVLKMLAPHLSVPIQSYRDAEDFELIAKHDEPVFILIGVDVFDPDASKRTADIRELVRNHDDTFLLAMSSFMPGAYRELVMMSGADDCVLEAVLLKRYWRGDSI